MPASSVSIRFLGTSSQPSSSRNYSSLLLNLDRESVMVDCGEGTQRQMINRHIGGDTKLSAIHTILITHLHADHVLGLVPLMYSMMGPSSQLETHDRPRVEIYGPLGLRALIRTQLTLCYTALQGKYVVHELLWPQQQQEASSSSYAYQETDAPLTAAIHGPRRVIPLLPLHESEIQGRDIILDEATASWTGFTSVSGWSISAAPILHRCPAVGYVFREPPRAAPLPKDTFQRLDANADRLISERGVRNPRSLVGRLLHQRETIMLPDGTTIEPPPLNIRGRKICICGDTKDATGGLSEDRGLTALALDADVLVHESTNIALPLELSQSKKVQSLEEVIEKAHSRGHSTPQGAGRFAAKIRAKALILNHFSVRYPAPAPAALPPPSRIREGESSMIHPHQTDASGGRTNRNALVMKEFQDQATQAWHSSPSSSTSTSSYPFTSSSASSSTTPWSTNSQAIASWDGMTFEVWREEEVGQMERERERVHSAQVEVGTTLTTGGEGGSSEGVESPAPFVQGSNGGAARGQGRGGSSMVRRGRGRGRGGGGADGVPQRTNSTRGIPKRGMRRAGDSAEASQTHPSSSSSSAFSPSVRSRAEQ